MSFLGALKNLHEAAQAYDSQDGSVEDTFTAERRLRDAALSFVKSTKDTNGSLISKVRLLAQALQERANYLKTLPRKQVPSSQWTDGYVMRCEEVVNQAVYMFGLLNDAPADAPVFEPSNTSHTHDYPGKCPVRQEYFDAWEKGEMFPQIGEAGDPRLAARIEANNLEELAKTVAWMKKRIG